MLETKYTKTLYAVIQKLNLPQDDLKTTLLCLYVNGCSPKDCVLLFGTIEEKTTVFIQDEGLYGLQACSKCGQLRDREEYNERKYTICKNCKRIHNRKYYTDNRETFIQNSNQYTKNNKEKISKYKKEYYEKTKKTKNRRKGCGL